jgi:predicted DCC family thiol-disulfide oxidoreductase YuxK
MSNNLELMIDEDCPMCNLYGKYLAKNDLVTLNSYQNSVQEKNTAIDYEKAKNQIALIDHDNNKILYGLEALYRAFGTKFPKLISFMKLSIPAAIMPKVYAFISYNRKQIAPSNSKVCTPSFILKYRIAFLVFAVLFSANVVNMFCKQFAFSVLSNIFFVEILLISCSQIVIQYFILYSFQFEKRIDYLGNLATINIIASLLLLPLIFWNTLLDLAAVFSVGYLLLVFTVMLWQHVKRCTILGMGNFVTVSFVWFYILLLCAASLVLF